MMGFDRRFPRSILFGGPLAKKRSTGLKERFRKLLPLYMQILKSQGEGRIRDDDEKNRRHHRGGGGGAHRLGPAPDLEAALAADPGDEHGKDPRLDQAGMISSS